MEDENSQHLVKAMSQDSMTIIQTEVGQQLNGANTNTQQTANNSSQENSSSSSPGNASLVEYSDSNSSEKDSEAVEPSTSQGIPGIKFSNGVVPIPNALSDAIAKAKPNQKIQVDSSLKFVGNVVYKFPLKGGIKFYRYDGEFLVPNPDAEGMAGGGVGERREKALRGNATGKHMSTPQTNSHGNASLVEYSDSNSSEKDSEAVEPSTSQGTPGIKFSNGVVPIPNALSDAIAKAKPNQKIQVDSSLKFVGNVVYKFPLKGGIKFYRYDGEFLVPNPDAEGMAGGGVGERREKALRGNATGKHMSTPQTNSHGNASLVEYSDSNSSEKDSEAVEPSTSQGTPGIKFSNGVVPIPNALSDAIAKAKPNQKIQVDSSLKFVGNVVYKFPLKGGIKFYRYDGEFLVPNPVNAEGMAEGGVGERRKKALRGNATGKHMSTPQTNRKFLKAAEAVGTKVFKGGRFWTHSGGPQKSFRATSSSNGEVQDEAEESSSQESNQGRKRPIEDVSDLPPIKDDEIRLVHCKFCGFPSYTVKSCERCHRTFPSDTKIEIEKKRFKQDDETCTPAIPKQTFYGKPTCGKMTVLIHTAQATKSDGSVVNVNYVSQGRRVSLEGKSYRSPSVIRGGRQPRKSYTSEPVTISISSDEEEETEKPTVPGSTATGCITTTTGSVTTAAASVATATANVTTATRSITPAAKQQNIPTSKGSDPSTAEKDDIGQLLDSIPQTKRSASPVLQGSRMVKMEDEEGKPILVRKSMRRKSPTQPASSSASASATAGTTFPQATTSTGDVSSVSFIADVVRIGSVPAVAIEPILVAEDTISFYLEFEETTEKFFLKPDELQQCMFCLENRPVIFLKTTVEFARKVRELLKLESKEGGLWFDPDDTAMKHQFITFAMKGLGSLTYIKLNSILQKYPKPVGQSFPYIVKMTGEEARVYMREVLEGEGENGGQVDSSTPQPHLQLQPPSPTSVKILFTGPVVKLITFPPPPAPGGIQVTNEDLSCLEEGEFLNDVIIDFYLKYLFLDVLSDRDRQRTHIFSSFFFKRLTQRQGRCGLEADMVDKTPAEKKHARVKNWTKKVDLFEKDFIFVPINEHSHWFLAVICFPGLQAPAQFSYIPKLTKPVTQKTLIAQIVSNLAAKSTETGAPIKSGETGKEPVNSLKGYKIPKVAKSGEEAQSESNNSEGMSVNDEENEKDNGERLDEPMETEEKDLSEAQKREIEEVSEEMMDTSESPSQTTSEDGDTDKDKSQPQCDNNFQEIVKSESESQEKTESESQEKTESESQQKTENETKEGLEKPMKIHFRTPAKDLRGRELTAEELKDPDVLKTCSYGWRQPCILVFDSLAGQNRSRIVAILKEYLQVEWETKKKSPYKEKIRGCTATKVPQQTNFSDCGVYLLQYVESFFEDPIQDFAIPLRPLTNWFTEERVTAKRKEIKDLVWRLKEIQEKPKS
ncbi:uncharacterized protein LOC111102878 isoform X2 [Crassostrea virginica]